MELKNSIQKHSTKRTIAHSILKLSGKAAGGAIGLAMTVQGIAMAGEDPLEKLQRMNPSDIDTGKVLSLPSPVTEEARLSLKKRIPADMQNKLLALSLLARNILNDPQVGQRFSADPVGYLADRGLGDVNLDLDSHEVKVVLALGDEEVRAAVAKGDKTSYLRLMEERGLLRFNGLEELGLTSSCGDSRPGAIDKAAIEACGSIIVLIACVVTIESDATVKSNSVIYTAAEGTGFREPLNSLDSKAALLMWGKDGVRELLKQHAANKADELAESIACLKIAKEKNLTKTQIRTVIERKLLAAMTE